MNKEKQRIAIAEACGWTFNPPSYSKPPFSTEFKAEALLCWTRPGNMPHQLEAPPNYLNDLNAMYEAEKVIKAPHIYNEQLEKVVLGYSLNGRDAIAEFMLRRATAAQRAEAFLKALNLWEE